MKKVLIIGSPGSGKSTFAKILARKTGLPLHHLDLIWFHNDGNPIAREEFDIKLQSILQSGNWIIDGYYPRTLELRLEYADTVFFFDLPPMICLAGALSRVGRIRDDNPVFEKELNEGLKERILNFKIFNTPFIYDLLEDFTGKVIIFRSHEDTEDWLKNYGKI